MSQNVEEAKTSQVERSGMSSQATTGSDFIHLRTRLRWTSKASGIWWRCEEKTLFFEWSCAWRHSEVKPCGDLRHFFQKKWRLEFLTQPAILNRVLRQKLQNLAVKWNSENRFTFVQKNSEWLIFVLIIFCFRWFSGSCILREKQNTDCHNRG